ncbi:MAG TPA: adenylosuccinate lyase [Steroidobacteraceae bacterium]|nr:adenylosuccinate lyase [Steroidobacteraceae bacterium]
MRYDQSSIPTAAFMEASSLSALSPIDGRYAAAAAALRPLFSEAGLMRERVRVEALWFQTLADPDQGLLAPAVDSAVLRRAAELAQDPPADAPAAIKSIEARINHDVKAVEYYVRDCLAVAGATPAALELVHFGCTSEDINNLAYARLLVRARDEVLLPELERLGALLQGLAREHAELPMLARTHGQPASPTTFGKEIANVGARLARARRRLATVQALGKWNGAVGNYNAHVVARPDVDWLALAREFVSAQQLQFNAYTTQIEPHDWIAEYCDACAAINVILIDLCRDLWGYISLGYLRQRPTAGEVGSSTMPHKVNPIDFENAEGNLGLANALLRFFSDKLPISRWQRDLTDSTVLRNLGVALAHMLIGWKALQRGLSKLSPDRERLAADLALAHATLAEAVQSVLRAAGVPGGYELMRDLTRGREVDARTLRELIAGLPLPAAERQRLAALSPAEYVGLAAALTHRFVAEGP